MFTYVPEAQIGDYVIIHGFAPNIVSEDEGRNAGAPREIAELETEIGQNSNHPLRRNHETY
jgi:hydrogenase maturation factor